MKRRILAVMLTAAFLLAAGEAALAADPAVGLVGIRLGQNVSEVGDLVLEDTAMPVWSQEYTSRVDIAPVPGFKGGYVSYGNCVHPGRILKMKLSYQDSSKEFFEKLVVALKSRYGKNPEFRGDPFGTLKVWKWNVEGPGGVRASLILENYTGDDDNYTRGNAIRLSVPTWTKEEASCWQTKGTTPQPAPDAVSRAKQLGFDWFLPQK